MYALTLRVACGSEYIIHNKHKQWGVKNRAVYSDFRSQRIPRTVTRAPALHKQQVCIG